MEDKKKGVNVSSGAKKVEKIEAATRAAGAQTKTVRTEKTSKTVKKTSPAKGKSQAAQKQNIARKKEQAAAEKRIALAQAKAARKEKKLLHKAQLKQKKLEKQAALKEKKLARKAEMQKRTAERRAKAEERRAALKAKRVERRAEKIARRETLKHESAAQKKRRLEREKKEKLALRRQRQESREKAMAEKRKSREAAHARRSQEKRAKRSDKKERRQHAPGFGGWLAATITLGVTTLALATAVTAGTFRMNDMNMAAANNFRTTLYEMVTATEQMDGNLNKLRVSEGVSEQRALLTDILVDTALLESAVERCPIDSATSTDISAFINKTNAYAKSMLRKLAGGTRLSAKEHATLNYLYTVNSTLYHELNELAMHVTEREMFDFINGKGSAIADKFAQMGQSTLQQPQESVDAPFAQVGNVGENQLQKQEEVSSARAEELVKEYLAAYRVQEVAYTGETVTNAIECYNFSLTDDSGVELFAQISKRGGKLVFFETYAPCEGKNFDIEMCDSIARDFLKSMGIDGVEAVWISENGTAADITYVTVKSGVRIYPESLRVRVCESKGRVVALEAAGYYMNGTERDFNATLSREKAEQNLSSMLTVRNGVLALIPVEGQEVLCYEFNCLMGEEEFIVYLDANSGEEVQMFIVRNSAQGKYLR